MGQTIKQYIVDAFSDEVFHGNPAAVCILEDWLPDELMLLIAQENNLSETAFAVPEDGAYRLRWFTPGGEISLCGHATLATAFVITEFYQPKLKEVSFHTMSGLLTVARDDNRFEMDFPAYRFQPVAVTSEITEALGAEPVEAFIDRDLLCVFEDEDTVRSLAPDEEKLCTLDGLLVHVTAPGKDFDCVSRSFASKVAISEDPVCGSGHCQIFPFWSERLEKQSLLGYQASKRGGILSGKVEGDRVLLGGQAVLYAESSVFV